jgi:hypothetical protein
VCVVKEVTKVKRMGINLEGRTRLYQAVGSHPRNLVARPAGTS